MSKTKGIPRYVQARERLNKQILSGEFQSGEKLPSEEQLAAQFGVSRMTIRKSLEDLMDAGLIYRRHGVGTFVSNARVPRNHTHLTDFFKTCQKNGQIPEARLLKKEIMPVSIKVAKELGLEPGDTVIRLTTLRLLNGMPITYHDAYLPVALFPSLVAAPADSLGLEKQHVWRMIEKMGFTLSNVIEQIDAVPAEDPIAAMLDMQPGEPILRGRRVMYSDDGTPLKYADCYNRGDTFSLTVVLVR